MATSEEDKLWSYFLFKSLARIDSRLKPIIIEFCGGIANAGPRPLITDALLISLEV